MAQAANELGTRSGERTMMRQLVEMMRASCRTHVRIMRGMSTEENFRLAKEEARLARARDS